MAGAYRLTEIAIDLLENAIRTNIAAALAGVRNQRADAAVTTEPFWPESYFRYEDASVYRAPACFLIPKSFDVRNEGMKANHINGIHEIIIAAVVEDRIKSKVTQKAWRYQCALMEILHLTTLTSSDNAVRLFSRVQTCEFSGLVDLKQDDADDAVFRKEVSLRLQVEHVENLE